MESGFYRRGIWARELAEISDDPEVLDDGNFWAVVITYEGKRIFARFTTIDREQEHPFLDYASAIPWQPIESTWQSSLDRNQYISAVREVRAAIAEGEVYQINLCRVLSAQTNVENLLPLIPLLHQRNPAPYLTSLELPNLSIASASPELLLRRSGKTIVSSPIKGTAREPGGFLEKDRAENVMIVDLLRHDFGSICATGSIHTPRLLDVEEHPGLVHLVSDIQGELLPDVTWSQVLAAILPGGSISGAPKSSAMRLIADLERAERGPYCGAIGWVQGQQGELAVGIRTFWIDHGGFDGGIVKFGTGAGITWGSDPQLEWEETELKARRLLSIINKS